MEMIAFDVDTDASTGTARYHAGTRAGGIDGVEGRPRRDEVSIWTGEDLRWEQLVEVARELGPDPSLVELDDDTLVRRVRTQAAEVAAGTCRYLQLVAELVVRGIWAEQGARTPAQWLSWAIGLGPSTAREHVRIALRLRDLPLIRERFRAGTISYSKARALTRVAMPQMEELLLSWADHATAGEIEQIVRGWRRSRRVLRDDADDTRSGERVEHRITDDGMMVIVVRARPERGEELLQRLRRIVDLDEAASAEAASDDGAAAGSPEAIADGPIDPLVAPASRPDRGERMVQALLDALAAAAADDPGDTTGADRHTLVLHAPVDALSAGDDPAPRVPVEAPRGRTPSMSPATLRRLACQAGVVLAATDGLGNPIDVGRRHRRLTPALVRALRLRDRSCRFPGCSATRHLHAHHVVHWADGGSTDLANLVLVCSHHHRFVHERRWRVTGDGAGRFSFAPPDGDPLPRSLPPVAVPTDRIAVEPHRDPASLQPIDLHTGPVDHDMAVAVLHQELSRVLPDLAAAA